MIVWERHSGRKDGTDAIYTSACGQFEVWEDPVYGYLSLRLVEDPFLSLGEGRSLGEMGEIAKRYLEANGSTARERVGR